MIELLTEEEAREVKSRQTNIPEMLTLKQASARTNLSYDYLRKLCLSNQIVHIKAGNKFLINMPKLAEFLNGEAS